MLGVDRMIFVASKVQRRFASFLRFLRFIATMCTSAVKSLRLLKNRTVVTIVLNIIKTIAVFGELPRLRKEAYDYFYDKPRISANY